LSKNTGDVEHGFLPRQIFKKSKNYRFDLAYSDSIN